MYVFPSENFVKVLDAPLDACGGHYRRPEAKDLSPSCLTLYLRSFEPEASEILTDVPHSQL